MRDRTIAASKLRAGHWARCTVEGDLLFAPLCCAMTVAPAGGARGTVEPLGQFMRFVALLLCAVTVVPAGGAAAGSGVCSFADRYPRQDVAYMSSEAPTIDGRLDEAMWRDVAWSEAFVDIRGADFVPAPWLETRVKIRWDAAFLYVAAWLEEPQIWANITQHNEVIFQDNDFEVFVDAASSASFYKELEINARGATWALCLNKPYANGGYENSSRVFPGSGWDFSGSIRSAVTVEGPLNVPSDDNRGWTVEMALPLADLMYNNTSQKPGPGTLWRINFSRVEWRVTVVGQGVGHFEKRPGVPEDNWVWAPQGQVAMHLPERWGFLQFADDLINRTVPARDASWTLRSLARILYEAQETFYALHGVYAASVLALAGMGEADILVAGTCGPQPQISLTTVGYTARIRATGSDHQALISQDRLLVIQPCADAACASGPIIT